MTTSNDAAENAGGPATNPSSTAKIATGTATAIAVADMIGIGVFTSLGFQVLSIQSGFVLVMLWVVGGIVALAGALSYAELGAAFPRSGGEYNFLGRVYHPALGFMAGWLSATVGFAAPVALAAMALGSYFKGLVPDAPALLTGLAVTWAVAAIHLTGLKHSARFHNWATVIKIALIVAFIGAGLMFGEAQPVSFLPAAGDFTTMVTAPFAISLVFVMYSYSGWNASTYIIGELDEPQRTVPRSLFAATLIVLVLYAGLNAVFLYTTPISAMAGKLDIAQIAGAHIFGPAGGKIVGALICIGLVSAISAMTWIGPRVTMVMGEDTRALAIFAKTTRAGVPAAAIVVQTLIATGLMITQSFESVLDYIAFSLTLSSFLTVLGVIVLRLTQPALMRPYKVWAFPLTPLVFLGVTGFMLVYLVTERPWESLAGLATMAAGLAIYFASARRPS